MPQSPTPSSPKRSRFERDATRGRDLIPQAMDREILDILLSYGYLEVDAIALAYEKRRGRYATDRKTGNRVWWSGRAQVQKHVRALYDAELIDRWHYPTRVTGFGSDALIYTIRRDGLRLLTDSAGYRRHMRAVLNLERPKSPRTVHHRIGLSLVRLFLDLGLSNPRVVETRTDRRTKLRVRLPGRSRRSVLQPDLLAVVQFPDGGRRLVVVELDTSHKGRAPHDARFRAYRELLTEELGRVCDRFNVEGASLVILGESESRQREILAAARATWRDFGRRRRPLLLVSHLEHFRSTEPVPDRRRPDGVANRDILADPEAVFSASIFETLEGRTRPLFSG